MPMNPRLLRPLARRQAPTAFPAADLLAFWKLADTTDASGNGNTLTNTNSVAFVAGKIGNAAEFDFTNYLSRSMSVDFSAAFTVSLWCKPADVATYGVMIYGGSGGTFAINYTGGNSIDINNAATGFLNVAADPDEWHHVAVTKDATDTKVWLNGVLETQGENQGNSSATTIYLGNTQGTQNYTGFLDAVGIWSRVLSDAEIALLYNSGAGREP